MLPLLLISVSVFGQLFTATSSGDWDAGATWGNAGSAEGVDYPGPGDSVVIKNEATVTVNISSAQCGAMQLGSKSNPDKGSGTISFNNGSELTTSGVVSYGDGGNSGYVVMTSGGTWNVNSWSGKKGSITSGTGTINFTGNFTMTNSTSFTTFNNLEINGNVNQGGDLTINGDLTLSSGTLDPSQNQIDLKGNWIQNGGSFDEGTHTGEVVVFSGSSSQQVSGGEVFNKVELNNSNGLVLSGGDMTVNEELDLTAGDIILGSNNLYLGSTGSIASVSDASHIITTGTGEFRKYWPASNGESFTFPLGDGANYTPFSITITSGVYGGGAYVNAQLTNSKEPNHSEDDYVTRYWTVSAFNILNATYDWSASYVESDVVGTEANIYGYKWDGASWAEFDIVDSTSNVLSGTGATSFSSFTGRKGLITLPIELTRFEVEIENNAAIIEWETSAEINNDYFVVEKSKDGVSFEPIEKVMGAGNSTETVIYNMVDGKLSDGVTYYRLKQVDFDGSYSYSNVKQVYLKKDNSFSVYPNPVVSGEDFVVEGNDLISVRLFDLAGNLIETVYADEFYSEISTESLSPGTYLAAIHNHHGTHTLKFVVK